MSETKEKYVETIRAIIEYLELVQKKPRMYISSETNATLHDHLWGLEFGLKLFGLKIDDEIFGKIEHERGWDNRSSFGSEPHMRKKGLTESQIFHEYLSMYIETWKQMLTELEQDSSR